MSRVGLCVGVAVCVLAVPSVGSAQWVVYDPANYAQAAAAYTQAVQQYAFLVRQARRLPAAVINRYRVPEIPWQVHRMDLTHDLLGPLQDVVATLPTALQSRLTAHYAAIDEAERLLKQGMDQAAIVRLGGGSMMRAIQAAEDDAASAADEYHSETALLNKINGASVLSLRIAERGTQFLAHAVEQLIVDNRRKQEAESALMHAHLFQWRYGRRYGEDLFAHTARGLDGWRQP